MLFSWFMFPSAMGLSTCLANHGLNPKGRKGWSEMLDIISSLDLLQIALILLPIF